MNIKFTKNEMISFVCDRWYTMSYPSKTKVVASKGGKNLSLEEAFKYEMKKKLLSKNQ